MPLPEAPDALVRVPSQEQERHRGLVDNRALQDERPHPPRGAHLHRPRLPPRHRRRAVARRLPGLSGASAVADSRKKAECALLNFLFLALSHSLSISPCVLFVPRASERV